MRAKVGDKIRIVSPILAEGRYVKGDILTVTRSLRGFVHVAENSANILDMEYEIINDVEAKL